MSVVEEDELVDEIHCRGAEYLETRLRLGTERREWNGANSQIK